MTALGSTHTQHIPVSLVRDGMRYATDGIVFDALAPSEPPLAEGPNDVNETPSSYVCLSHRSLRRHHPEGSEEHRDGDDDPMRIGSKKLSTPEDAQCRTSRLCGLPTARSAAEPTTGVR